MPLSTIAFIIICRQLCTMYILPLTTTAYGVDDTVWIVMLVLKICITLK